MKWLRNKMSTLFSRTLFGMLAVSLTVLIITAGSLFVWFRTEMVRGYYELIHAAMGKHGCGFLRKYFRCQAAASGLVRFCGRGQPPAG